MRYISADRLQRIKLSVTTKLVDKDVIKMTEDIFDVLITECEPISRPTHVTLHSLNRGEILVRPELVEMVIDQTIITSGKEVAVKESLEEMRELFNRGSN